ncbi:MAG: response regulator [Rhodospirillales bacterium]
MSDPDPPKAARASILIVDDAAPVRMMIRTILAHDGYDLVEAANGVQALAILRRRAFDVLITDIFMAEKDGYELIMEARQIDPGLQTIAVSGGQFVAGSGWDPLRTAARMGADETLSKPFSREALLSAVARCLARRAG